MTGKVRWGILGAAKIANNAVVPALQRSRNGRATLVASRDLARAQAFAARHDIAHASDSYEALIASPEVDAIYIPLPTASHFEWCKKALLGGKHVLCEKPIVMNSAAAQELIALRDQTGLVCGEAFMVAHHPQWAFVRDSLAQGLIGELKLVEGSFTYFKDDPDALNNNLALGGGGVRDIGVYPVVTTRIATGLEPHRIRSEISLDPRYGTDRFALCVADFPGFALSFYCGTQMALRQHMTFHGTQGWLSVDAPFNPGGYAPGQVRFRLNGSDEEQKVQFTGVDQYQAMVEDFSSVVTGEKAEIEFPLESSLANQRVIDQILA